MTNLNTTEIKLTNAELKANYAKLRDDAKLAHDMTSGTFKYPSFAEHKSAYNIAWDFAHPNDKDALVVDTTPSILEVIDSALGATSAAKKENVEGGKVSKMSLARAIFAEELKEKGAAGLVRKVILARFAIEAGCTPAGANTYYNTLRDENGLVTHKA
jgi:hypothetical protein